MTSKKKFCILGASFNTSNLGVGALAAGIVTSIVAQHPDAEISFMDYAKEASCKEFFCRGKRIPIQLVNIRFSKKLFLPNNIAFLIVLSLLLKLVPFRSWRHRMAARNRCLKHLQEMDVVGAIAGGDSFSDIYGLPRFFYVALPQILVLLSGCELHLLPQTFGPFRKKITGWLAKYIFRGAHKIYSRDQEGLHTVRLLLGTNKVSNSVQFCYDVGFVAEPIPPTAHSSSNLIAFDHARPQIGLNVSGLLSLGGYTRNNMFGLKVNYKNLIRGLIAAFIDVEEADVTLVPHVFGNGIRNPESDSVICEALYEELRPKYGEHLHLLNVDCNQNEIKSIIGRFDFVIGSRMHACIAALSQSVPALAIAYSDKFVGVLSTLQVPELVADARVMTEEAILRRALDTFRDRQRLRTRLQHKMPAVQNEVLALFADEKMSRSAEPHHCRAAPVSV